MARPNYPKRRAVGDDAWHFCTNCPDPDDWLRHAYRSRRYLVEDFLQALPELTPVLRARDQRTQVEGEHTLAHQ